jgi:anti-sigma B factor antagonist
MKIEVKDAGKVRIVELQGRLAMGDATAAFERVVKEQIAAGHAQIVVNLARVSGIDSSGIGELVAAKKRCVEKGGDVRLLMPSDSVYQILTIVSLHLVFKIFDTEAKAVASFIA